MRVVGALIVALASPARGEPNDLVARPLVLAPDQIAAELTAEVNLAPTYFARPLSLAPDAWFGAGDRMTIGVVHSDPSVDRIEPGATACVQQDATICTRFYRGSGLDVRWSARDGDLAVAPRARWLVRDVSPWKPALTLGALARWTRGRFAIVSDPYLMVGLANRDLGNRAGLFVPFAFEVQPTCRWMVELRTGYDSELAVWRDGYHIPMWLGVRARATPQVDVGAALGFASLLGPQDTIKQRAAFAMVGWRSE